MRGKQGEKTSIDEINLHKLQKKKKNGGWHLWSMVRIELRKFCE